ncbi:protein of unknown function [Cupriavidus neocaledonicus]|uniref:Uncharacterized protein n=1 Tax=Cupriavidus neocaledonicus TaxID=1040979 RepID=A0A375H994_9BURK|nr:hypothetical protein CBM2605_A260192 [Cupriavidus neocaledonicus]SPD48312.1 protein of unknown function [Cupriavidus neocaledonicus]
MPLRRFAGGEDAPVQKAGNVATRERLTDPRNAGRGGRPRQPAPAAAAPSGATRNGDKALPTMERHTRLPARTTAAEARGMDATRHPLRRP